MVSFIRNIIYSIYYKYYWWGLKLDMRDDFPIGVIILWIFLPLYSFFRIKFFISRMKPSVYESISLLVVSFMIDFFFNSKRRKYIENNHNYDTKIGTILAIALPLISWSLFLYIIIIHVH